MHQAVSVCCEGPTSQPVGSTSSDRPQTALASGHSYQEYRPGCTSQVFEGLGNLGEEYTIRLIPNAVPYSLYIPHNVALPLREKVRKELNRMEAMGVIIRSLTPPHGVRAWWLSRNNLAR